MRKLSMKKRGRAKNAKLAEDPQTSDNEQDQEQNAAASDEEREEEEESEVNDNAKKEHKRNGKRSSKSSKAKDEKSAESNGKDEEEETNGDDKNGDSEQAQHHGKRGKKSSKKKEEKSKNKEKQEEDEDDSGEDEADYEVEDIMAEKVEDGVKYYLIRWKGYDESSDTWEPATSVNCPKIIKNFKNKNANKNKTKKAKKRTAKEANEKETWDENEEFEVDRIIEVHHKRDGSRIFLVSWKGYPMSQNTWEPEENLNCTDLINKFMKKVDSLKEIDAKNLREKRKHTDRFTLSTNDSGRRLSKRYKGKQRVHYHDAE